MRDAARPALASQGLFALLMVADLKVLLFLPILSYNAMAIS